MLRVLTEKESQMHQEELINFCKDDKNSCLMYNFMRDIQHIRSQAKDDYLNELKSKKKRGKSKRLDLK